MAIALRIDWPEVTPEVYEAARDRVRWEEDVPDGLLTHASWFDDGGFHVFDIWESEGQFAQFIAGRIEPVLKGELGLQSDPTVTTSPLHRRFVAPGVSGAA
ncbi:hypothetical protein [Streptomyces cupreus]|uniref:ABM domain-containing protein n=1 Tax=Streptomyces cupreus TaxID=2759956 RepID=A0A7X1JB37_9ACTN|nr:hypothetical protein [Streptomyces cupreus]MBC2907511.1 hypothetical protein [Streptomyces cupreus]